MNARKKWGPLRSILALSPVLIGAPLLAIRQHCTLPKPSTELIDPVTNLPQISEANILGVAKYLSEDIGYRTVGTKEHALADAWMVQQAKDIQTQCQRIVLETGRKLECEVWRQEGSGNHRFDIMGKRLYKTYVNLSNIIVRVSDGTEEGKKHAVLVNSHLDSTLPSPGAADDAISVGVMLDCMRVLVNTPNWSPKHAIVFLFNHAEESLQDGSHLYSTQHPTASTVRAVINLEAAGTTGRELLFQATSEQMIEAYSHVPRPYGTIFANDIFSSGIILSDTDFRQFEYYMNVTGLDMAIIGNSYLYHMRKDLVENIGVGVAQHMGENSLALLKYLSSDASPLPELDDGYTRPETVYFAHLGGAFFMYSFTTAKILYALLLISSIALVKLTFVEPPTPGIWRVQVKGMLAVVAGVFCTIAMPNLVAILMQFGLNKALSWFSNPFAPLALYGPAALLGALISQYLFVGQVHEQTIFTAILLLQSFLALATQLANIGSAAMFFITALPLFVVLALNPVFSGTLKDISLVTYGLGQVLPLLTGSLLLIPTIEVFVPLTGRIGGDAPADNIIATLASCVGASSLPLVLPLAHRFGRKSLLKGILFTSIVSAASIAFFSMKMPFDEMHQKRVFVIYMENVTTSEHHLHIAAADGAPGFESLVNDLVKQFGTTDHAPTQVVMDDYNSDWNSLYPFSAFLTPYKVPLAVPTGYISPWVKQQEFVITTVTDIRDHIAETRNLTIRVDHPGLIWTVVSFDAHVLKWSLDDNPPAEFARHHIREGSFYGTDSYTFDMVIKLSPETLNESLLVDHVGLQEKGIWPGKKNVKDEGGVAMALFEELDAWLDVKTGGAVDALLMGGVGGIEVV